MQSATKPWGPTKNFVRRNNVTGFYHINKWIGDKVYNESTGETDFCRAVTVAEKRIIELKELARCVKFVRKNAKTNGILGSSRTHHGVLISEMLAYPVQLAARLLGISSETLRGEIAQGKLRQTPLKLVPRAELIRYLEVFEIAAQGNAHDEVETNS